MRFEHLADFPIAAFLDRHVIPLIGAVAGFAFAFFNRIETRRRARLLEFDFFIFIGIKIDIYTGQ